MKACPHCAKQVRDAAVCPQCGREITSVGKETSGGSQDVGWVGVLVVVLVGAIAVGVVHSRKVAIARLQITNDSLAGATRQRVQRRADSVDAVTPHLLPLLDKTLTVDARGYYVTTFVVPSGARCAVVGEARGVASDDTFAALVLTDDGIVQWQADPEATNPLWQSGQTVAATFDVALPAAGTYGLVVSNRATSLLKHHVVVTVQARCTRDWPPR